MTFLSLHPRSNQKQPPSIREEHTLFQLTIDQIISQYVDLQHHERNNENLLACIYKNTRNSAFFHPSFRLVSLAKLSNHLLQLVETFNKEQLFTITQNVPIYIKELNRYLFIQLEMGEWKDNNSFVIKKVLWSNMDKELIVNLISIYVHHAYIQTPKEIELIDINGKEGYRYSLRHYSSAVRSIEAVLNSSSADSLYGTFYSLTKEKQQ
ncbi:hypothetical protein JOC85_001205 [Bacillus mesophilus]|uniref:Uncharacterized protein n=1 Tax=Bacillus mesophilus TaxID=1808955 RepID=A0A6M0Q6P9_9BACI|nr:hypothetical protein [Bacillus mesophilus]MBM7660433.1 hypothetical protein [Bacillus mesophilus]NEY72015.1 hypothetical protein [Bacillus mesophilus]